MIYDNDYSKENNQTRLMDALKDSDYHHVDELRQWAEKNKVYIMNMYDKPIGFEDYFMKNMTALIQNKVINSPLPIEFTMESVTLYIHNSYSIDSPIWSLPE